MLAIIVLCLACVVDAGSQPSQNRGDLGNLTVIASYRDASFEEMISGLATQVNRSVAADGSPFKHVASLEFSGAAAAALDRICQIFDYRWRLGPGGIILLNRRFEANGELPQAKLEEIRAAANDITKLIKSVGTPPSPASLNGVIQAVAASLTAPQVQSLRDGNELQVAQLPVEQRQLVYSAIIANTFGMAYGAWEDLKATLDNILYAKFSIETREFKIPATSRVELVSSTCLYYPNGTNSWRRKAFPSKLEITTSPDGQDK